MAVRWLGPSTWVECSLLQILVEPVASCRHSLRLKGTVLERSVDFTLVSTAAQAPLRAVPADLARTCHGAASSPAHPARHRVRHMPATCLPPWQSRTPGSARRRPTVLRVPWPPIHHGARVPSHRGGARFSKSSTATPREPNQWSVAGPALWDAHPAAGPRGFNGGVDTHPDASPLAHTGTGPPAAPAPGLRLANARLVDLASGAADEPIDLWVVDGRLARCPGQDDSPVIDLQGRWVLPGLWDAHVHMTQWAMARRRLDLSTAGSSLELLDALASELLRRPDWAHDPVVGVGVRSAGWRALPTADQFDADRKSVV